MRRVRVYRGRPRHADLYPQAPSLRDAGGDRGEHHLLSPRPHRAGRSAVRDPAGRRDAGAGGRRCAPPTASTSRCRCSTRCGSGRCCTAISAIRSPPAAPVASEVTRAVGNTLILATVATADRVHASARSSASSPAISAAPGSTSWPPWCRCSASACRITGSAWCWSSSSRSNSTGCRPTGAGPGGSGRLAPRRRASALSDPAGHHHVGDSDGHRSRAPCARWSPTF